MQRVNTVSWVKAETLMRLMHALQQELMSYQKHTLPDDNRGRGHLGGDSGVMIAAISLKRYLDRIIEENPN